MPSERDKYKYPLLMKGIFTDRIIYMTADSTGTVVGTGQRRASAQIGFHSDSWPMCNFKPYKG